MPRLPERPERLFANPASVTDAKISQTVAITAFEQPAQLVCIETDAQTRSGLRLGSRKMGVVLIDDKVVNIIERDKSCANLPATAWANWGDFNAVNAAAFNVAANRDSNQPNGQ